MIDSAPLHQILFLDIETVPQQRQFADLDETFQELWYYKAKSILRKDETELTDQDISGVYERAGIYAEFGKIVCISVGVVSSDPTSGALSCRLKSFCGDDEKALLTDFCALLDKSYNNPEKNYLCGHNIKEFDIPYICRRMTIHRMQLPKLLDISGKKPWETKFLLDTLEMWKFGDNKNYTSLKLLCGVFGFPSPKDDIDGSQVGKVYWEEQDTARIATYCQKDVLAVIQLLLCFKRMEIIPEDQVSIVK